MKPIRRFVSTTAAFSLLGPLIGNLVFALWLWGLALTNLVFGDGPDASFDTRVTVFMWLLSLPFGGIPFAYVYGFVPAAITGLLVAALVYFFPFVARWPRYSRVGIAAATAAAVCGGWFTWMYSFDSAVACAVVGVIAACAVGYFWPKQAAMTS